jgi:uncharacterized membrane protein
MIHMEMTTIIERPLTDVFAFVADFATLPRYDRWVESVEKTSSGPIGVDTTWTHQRVQGRRRITAPIRLVEYQPSERLAMVSGSAGFDVRSMMVFRSLGDARTEFTETLEMRLSGFPRLLEPFIRRQVGPQSQEVHVRLKQILEAD